MAASVVGSFEIIDKASRPIKGIRDAAIEADLAVKDLGRSLDKVGTQKQLSMMSNTGEKIRRLATDADQAAESSDHVARNLERVGAPQLANNLNTTNRSIANTSSAAKTAERDVGDMSDRVDVLGKRSEKAAGGLRGLSATLPGLKAALVATLVPLVGFAAQGIGSLLAGVTSLLPKLTDLTGMFGPMGVAFTGMGVAMITTKLAFNDLAKAMNGNKKALEELTPQGKAFLATLKLYKPVLQEIRSSAQEGLFPGLNVAVRQLASAQPVLSQIVKGMGSTLGGFAANASKQFTGTGFLTDFQAITEGGQRTVGRFGEALLHLANVARNFLTAALPFTDWLTHTLVHFSVLAERSSTAARETGRLGEMFQRTQSALTTFGGILKNVFDIVKAVGHASRSMGEGLWESIDRTTKKWADFLSGGQGQNDMVSYFTRMQPVLHSVGKFFGDLVKGLGELAGGTGAQAAFRQLDEAIPSLVKGISTLTEAFGPSVILAFSEAVKLIGTLASDSGPVGGMLHLFAGVLQTVNSLIKQIPALGILMSTALAAFGTAAILGRITGMENAVGKLARSWFGVTGAANEAAAAESRAAGVGVSGGVAAARGRYPAAPAAGYSRAATAAESGSQNSFAGLMMTGAAGGAALKQRAGSLIKGLPSAALGGLAAGAEFLAPLMVLQGIFGAVGGQGGVGERAASGLNAGTFGLSGLLGGPFVPHPDIGGGAAAERSQAAFMRSFATGRGSSVNLGGGMPTFELAGAKRPGFNAVTGAFTGQGVTGRIAQNQISSLRTESHANEQALQGKFGHQSTTEQGFTRGQLSAEITALHDYEGYVQSAIAKARTHGTELAQGFGTAYSIYERSYGPQKAFAKTSSEVLGSMKHLGPQGKQALGAGVLSWAKELEAREPALRKPIEAWIKSVEHGMDGMGQHVRIVNGEIFSNTNSKWPEIAKAIEGPAAHAEYVTRGIFSRIFQDAVAQLEALGYSKTSATALIKGVEHGEVKANEISNANSLARNNTLSNNATNHRGAKKHAGGGRIGGHGLQDSVPLQFGMAAPGELVVNRHQERLVNGLLHRFGTSLGQVVSSHPWPHNAGFASGGFVPSMAYPGAQGRIDQGVDYGAAGPVRAILPGTVHSVGLWPGWPGTGGLTYSTGRGGVYVMEDFAPGAGMRPGMHVNAGQVIGAATGGSSGIETGWTNSSFSGPIVRYGSAADGTPMSGGKNFARFLGGGPGGGVAGSTALGAGVMAQIKLARQKATGGIPSALATAAYNSIALGAEKRINSKIGAAGGTGIGGLPGSTSPGGSHAANEALGRQMMLAAGWPASQWPSLQKLWTQESGWDANSVNSSSGAYGIPQSLGHGNPFPLGVAGPQIQWGLNYIKERYGSPSGAWAHEVSNNWYGAGGRIPSWGGWNKMGGSGVFNKPTLIGVGDGHGAEKVSITPHTQAAGRGGRGGTGGVQVVFQPGSIIVQGADEKAAQELVDKVMHKLAGELENMDMESEGSISQ
jgi:hypothetical protein